MSEDFGSYPQSISEARASKSESPEDWTPRDALISLLRELDSGNVTIRHLIICFSDEREGSIGDNFVQAGPANAHEQVGLLQSIVSAMWHQNH